MNSAYDEAPLPLLAPRGVGEILSDSLALLRRLFGLIFVTALPFCVLDLVMQEGASALLADLSDAADPTRWLGADPDEQGDVIWSAVTADAWRLGLALLLQSIRFLVIELLGGAVILAASAGWMGQRLLPVELIASALRRTGAILLTVLLWTLGVLAVGAGFPFLVVVGALLAFGPSEGMLAVIGVLSLAWLLVCSVYLWLRWAMYLPVILLEGLSGRRALSRSAHLMGAKASSFWGRPKLRLSVLLLVYLAMTLALQSLFAVPGLVQGVGQSSPFLEVSLWSLPLWMSVPLAALQVASNSVVMPLYSILATLFYFDVRVRHEGFDLGQPLRSEAR